MTINADIDRIFKDGLSEYSPKAPSYIWDNIEQNLHHHKNKNRRTFIYGIAASVAILIAFGAGFLITNKSHKSQIENAGVAVVDSSLNSNPVIDESAQPLADDEEIIETGSGENKTPNETKPEIKPEKEVKSKAIKATSSGILLPPMFGEQSKNETSGLNVNISDTLNQAIDTINIEK